VEHPIPDKITGWPLWWFARLTSALERDDDRAAAAAIQKLEKLGIEVRFRIPPRGAGRRAVAQGAERQAKGVSDVSR
jgi:hypothetical protein